jgi:hypothetical protein
MSATSVCFPRLQPQENGEAEEKIPDEFQQGDNQNVSSKIARPEQHLEAEQCSKTPQ